MTTIINGRSNLATDPTRNFRFLVTFAPHKAMTGVAFDTNIGFTSVSGLSVTTESIPYREGGYNTSVHQIPGQSTFSPVTMQRGVVLGSKQNWQWMKRLYKVIDGSNGTGAAGADFRCDVQIRVLQHPAAGSATNPQGLEIAAAENDLVAIRFKLYNAWVTSLAYSDLNAGDNALLVEQMTLVHEGFDVSFASGPNATAPAFTY